MTRHPDLEASPAVPASAPRKVGELCIGTRRFQLLNVDGLTPRPLVNVSGARTRLAYHVDEVAHFDIDGSRYALVPVDPSPAPVGKLRDPRALLTSRELQIVQLICLGLLTKQVADRLHLSEFTVRSYLKTIYCKLGVRSRAAMVYTFAQAFGVRAPLQVCEE